MTSLISSNFLYFSCHFPLALWHAHCLFKKTYKLHAFTADEYKSEVYRKQVSQKAMLYKLVYYICLMLLGAFLLLANTTNMFWYNFTGGILIKSVS